MESQEKLPPEAAMPLTEHLEELRKRLLRYALVLLVLVLACYGFRKEILDAVRAPVEGPLEKYSQRAQEPGLDPAEAQGPSLNLGAFQCSCLPSPMNSQVGPTEEAEASAMEVTPEFPLAQADETPSSNAGDEMGFLESAINDFKIFYLAMTGREEQAAKEFHGEEAIEREKAMAQMTQGMPAVMNLNCQCQLKTPESAGHMVYLGLPELFFAQMKVAIYSALFFSFPFLILELWGFVGPALYREEKKLFWFFALFSFVFFLGGAMFGYFVVFPFGIDFFLSLSQPGEIMPSLAIGDYLDFTIKIFIAFGMVFELPLVVLILSRMGIVTPRMMIEQSRLSFVVILIISALLTPPDPFTMMLMAGPLIGLYIISIGVSFLAVNRKKAALRAQGINPEEFEENF